MARTLITGMSGAGKSTLLAELARRGHKTVDTDDDGWESPHGFWNEPRMATLLATEPDLFVSGTVENQGLFYDRFDHVVLLTAPLRVLIARVSTRINNSYGHSPAERAEIRRYVTEVEPHLRAGATIELDGQLPTTELADLLERTVSGEAEPSGS
jgi:shikimate kinase